MSKQAAFWDASALVPLCVQEASSRQAHTQLRKFMPVVWWGSPVEVHSAIARLHGSGNLKDVEKQGALSRRSAEPRMERNSSGRSRTRFGSTPLGYSRIASRG